MSEIQNAKLIFTGGESIEVKVPGFPDYPNALKYHGKIFIANSPAIGYGVNYLTYTQASVYEIQHMIMFYERNDIINKEKYIISSKINQDNRMINLKTLDGTEFEVGKIYFKEYYRPISRSDKIKKDK